MKNKIIILFLLLCAVAVNAQTKFTQTDELMPVELVYFIHSTFAPDSVQLLWGTATESNNYGFDVERKALTGSWETLGFVEGNGTSNSPKNYSFGDTTVVENNVYLYRLKQIDIVGTFKYSDTVTVHYLTDIQDEVIELPKQFQLNNAYPNPFNGGSKISYYLNKRYNVSITVFDLQGAVIQQLVNSVQEEGNYEVNFNPAVETSAGIYFYKIELKNEKGELINSAVNKLIYLK